MIKSNIAAYLDQKGIKKVYLSQKTGIPASSVTLLLKGKRSLDIEEYIKICDALGVPYDFFFDNQPAS